MDFEELRVLGPEKEMLGVMSTEEALEKGEELGLDLVIVSPEADPPVAKLMDYSKYKYEKEKKDREKKRQAKLTQVELKEVKMRYNIDTHDYDVRLRSSQKFLSNGDKVKVDYLIGRFLGHCGHVLISLKYTGNFENKSDCK